MNKPIKLKLYLCRRLILNSKFLILNYKVNPPVNFVDILPYKGRQTPLTPLHRGGLGLLAFSLIELSIVLIIIGLLVAGVTGGKSLIDSAKQRALINELREYERAVWTFRAARDRFPGDVMNYGTFGWWSNYYGGVHSAKPYYAYKETDFPSDFMTEFRKTAGASAIPSGNASAPFVELYTEGILDFKPLGNEYYLSKNNLGIPMSKVIKAAFLYYHTRSMSDYLLDPKQNGDYERGLGNFGSIGEAIAVADYDSNVSNGMDPRLLKQIDLKLDDGEYWNGIFRAGCYGKSVGGAGSSDTLSGYTDYDYAIENGKKCRDFYYAI